jgi:hypothetical protein
LARSLVSGNSRVPAPPPITIDNTRLVLGDICDVPGVEAIGPLRRETGTSPISPRASVASLRHARSVNVRTQVRND